MMAKLPPRHQSRLEYPVTLRSAANVPVFARVSKSNGRWLPQVLFARLSCIVDITKESPFHQHLWQEHSPVPSEVPYVGHSCHSIGNVMMMKAEPILGWPVNPTINVPRDWSAVNFQDTRYVRPREALLYIFMVFILSF